jgi:hypothetical protein
MQMDASLSKGHTTKIRRGKEKNSKEEERYKSKKEMKKKKKIKKKE